MQPRPCCSENAAKTMLFGKLRKISAARRQLLPFIQSIEDIDIVFIVGAAYDEGRPLGLKQLEMLKLAPPSTLQRRLNRLVREGVLKKTTQNGDGRRIAYLPTARTVRACGRFLQIVATE